MPAERVTILVPVDFEGASQKAIDVARWLSGAMEAELVLLHVHDRPAFDHPELPDEMVTRVRSLVEEAAIKSLAALAAEAGVTRTLFRHGDPAAAILAATAELAPAMVVMGTHGRRGLRRLFVGSVAAQVVRASAVPVVTVRSAADEDDADASAARGAR
jgi:nucleotide-binding universal stress UspA family protein